MLFFRQPEGVYDFTYFPKNKNKISSFKDWGNDNWGGAGPPVWKLSWIDSLEWEIDPFSCRHNTFYKNMCIWDSRYKTLNEQYLPTSLGALTYDDVINCDPKPSRYNLLEFIYKEDDRGRFYERIDNQTSYNPIWGDTSIVYITSILTVDSFTYIVRPPAGTLELPADKHTLLIVPNPSEETVRITAVDAIATISFYASDGRLAYSRDGAGKEMTVNIQGLAAGVYVVQAQLKNGGVQAGKVVVR
jgi:hypothetical protein